jgi:hypothetical protein
MIRSLFQFKGGRDGLRIDVLRGFYYDKKNNPGTLVSHQR